MKIRLHALQILLFLSLTLDGEEARGPLNEHLPDWITLGAQVRYRAEGQQDQNYLLERYRFDVGIQPLPWMVFFGELQDARAAHMPVQDASVKDRVDLRQAYVRIGTEEGVGMG